MLHVARLANLAVETVVQTHWEGGQHIVLDLVFITELSTCGHSSGIGSLGGWADRLIQGLESLIKILLTIVVMRMKK